MRYNTRMEKSELVRINKYLANLGVASRRSVDEMIEQGRIVVNGKAAVPGMKINPFRDEIFLNGKAVTRKDSLTYIILNKPKGVISTVEDTHHRETVTDMVKTDVRLYPVGRLDQDSEGLVLLTNDGELTFRLTHPKYHIPKIYEVSVLGQVKEGKLQELRNGVELEDGKTQPAKVTALRSERHRTLLQITLYEGRKRQIRRMAATLHLHVLQLKRVKIGPVELGDLREGKYRTLTKEEVATLKKAVRL
jgi:23S rRNA pseudouridine2605 synthase